jgi:hypothetical protein
MRLSLKVLFLSLVLALSLAPLAELSAASVAGPRLSAPTSTGSTAASVLSFAGSALAIGMAIRIKSTQDIAKKFVGRAGVAGGDYADGVKAAGGDWEANTKAAEDNYKQSVTQAANEGRFGKGVAAAGAAKYVDKASTLGTQRYPTGVAASEGAYARGVGPHLDMMRALELPPRRPKGQNAARADAVAQANRKLKLGR